jgi:uncharacterized protein (TIGR02147 family)
MSIFEFSKFQELFQHKLRASSPGLGGAKLGLDRIAKRLGYRSPSLISMVGNGKRLPSNELLHALADEWKLTAREREYVYLLVQLERLSLKKKDTTAIARKISGLASNHNVRHFQKHEFSEISEWQFMVVKQLVSVPGFQEDPVWISQSLRKKVSAKKAADALRILEEKGLLARDPETKKLYAVHDLTETTHDIPSTAIRAHHRGMLERAAEALEEQAVDRRHFNSLSFKVNPKDLPAIKAKITEFTKNLYDQYHNNESHSVYQLNSQLFEHTKTDYRTIAPESSHEH